MTYEDLLYLDLDFLADKHEEVTGTAPKTVISKNEGMDAQAGISFLKSGLHSQVTRQSARVKVVVASVMQPTAE